MRPKNAEGNAERRERFLEVQRRMTALMVSLSDPPGTIYPADGLARAVPDGGAAALARLVRLEAGEPVRVRGDQVGLADHRAYILAGDGRSPWQSPKPVLGSREGPRARPAPPDRS
ncbi:MAG TPA: hypothetical protein VMV12_01895 [Candidatus Micrarchaeaceae archaeon]|nr:hypothetical protein [Candidatus Micrarchaeaceae archaeon]